MKFELAIRNSIETECEDYFLGIVDLSHLENTVIEKYNTLIMEYPRAISVGITLPYLISDGLKKSYKKLHRQTNCQLKLITSQLSELLENEGYRTFTMPKSRTTDGNDTSFHEVVASLANMGKIEKNQLITPEVGSMVNWGTVMTNAPLKAFYKKD
ncbi:4Fe-4S ferredoxin [Methanobacterium petrolearium]|uniref:4Fe-4S ferredoxin n=1 Tax=Methanobacterium petrolearium TaxID=710190 RepID=UPI001AE8A2B8|nr:4Fe-4S ferredoxin [Methanobacterium petrolearium]MBP1946558.1 epoxyqueuosine reductase QueG [Methanobacterium petrolearium]